MTLRTYVIEADQSFRLTLIEQLERHEGLRVVGHTSTEAAAVLWLLSNPNNWDLVVLDLLLAHSNGLRVLAACRVRSWSQRMVVLTDHATREITNRCQDLGASAVFDKSTEIKALLAYCRRQCETSLSVDGVGGAN